jgi:hypothetical protein
MKRLIDVTMLIPQPDGQLVIKPTKICAVDVMAMERGQIQIGNRIIMTTILTSIRGNFQFTHNVQETMDVLESKIESAFEREISATAILMQSPKADAKES